MGGNRTGIVLNRIAQKRTTFNWIFFILVLILGKGTLIYVLTGIPFILVGMVLRTLSSGTIKKNEILTDTGPYTMCRHPLYLGSFLISAGLVIISQSIFILTYFLIFFPITYIPTIFKEEKFLADKFGKAHLIYKKQTSLFVPDIRKFNLQNFSWKRVKENKEHINWLVILFLITVALIKSYSILKD